jgi:lipopolysaccharide export system protein LptA
MEDSKSNQKTGISTGRNFTYRERDTVITGQKAQYNEKQNRLLAEGELVLDDPKHHVVGDKADVDNSKRKLAIITGNVIITIKPKAEQSASPPEGTVPTAPVTPPAEAVKNDEKENASSVRGKGVKIFCDRVESQYDRRKKYVKIFGKTVKFTQKFTNKDGKEVERTVIAEHAEYDGIKDELVLFAPVKATDTEGQVMNFSGKVRVGTKEGEEWLESKEKSTGIFRVPDEDDEEENGKTPPR